MDKAARDRRSQLYRTRIQLEEERQQAADRLEALHDERMLDEATLQLAHVHAACGRVETADS